MTNRLKTAIRGKGLPFLVSISMTVVFVALRLWDTVSLQTLRLKGFDFYQRAPTLAKPSAS